MQLRLKQLDGVIDVALDKQVVQWDDVAKEWKAGRRNNVTAANPTASSDETEGYDIGSIWVNSDTGNAFICTDATEDAATWVGVSTTGEPTQEEYPGEVVRKSDPDTVLTAAPAFPPVSAQSVNLYLNGQLQRQGAGKDYTVTGGTLQVITWLTTSGTAIKLDANDIITIMYETTGT